MKYIPIWAITTPLEVTYLKENLDVTDCIPCKKEIPLQKEENKQLLKKESTFLKNFLN
jgi:hypothetical protein